MSKCHIARAWTLSRVTPSVAGLALALASAGSARAGEGPNFSVDPFLEFDPVHGEWILDGAPAADGCESLAYDEAQQKNAHNTFNADEGYYFLLTYWNIRSIEFDLNEDYGWEDGHDDFRNYHVPTDPGTSAFRLSSGLREVRRFHEDNPDHEVITIFLDLRLGDYRKAFPDWPERLDGRLVKELGAENIYDPQTFRQSCGGASWPLKTVVDKCGWPSLDELRGKFIIVIGDGGPAEQYTSFAGARMGFGMWDHDDERCPDGACPQPWRKDQVFVNLTDAQIESADDELYGYLWEGVVTHVWDLNDEDDFLRAKHHGVQHIASDINNDRFFPWARTRGRHGYPFTSLREGVDCRDARPDRRWMRLWVDTGDIDGGEDSDSFGWHYQDSGVKAVTWTATIEKPDSGVESWGKGCLMARESAGGSGAFFALCLPADNYRPRIQWRGATSPDDHGESDEVPSNPWGGIPDLIPYKGIEQAEVEDDQVPFFRLSQIPAGLKGWCYRGEASWDGVSFHTIEGDVCFKNPLRLQGIAASSHGQADGTKFSFSQVRRWRGGQWTIFDDIANFGAWAVSDGALKGWNSAR